MEGRLHDAKRNDRAEVGLEVLSKSRRDWVARFRDIWGSKVQEVRDEGVLRILRFDTYKPISNLTGFRPIFAPHGLRPRGRTRVGSRGKQHRQAST